jgi:hypothetical protein
MRPVIVKLPTATAIASKKVVSTSAVAFDLSSYVKSGGSRQFVFVAGAVDVYVLAGSTSTITDPVIASVDGSVSASRAVPLAAGVHLPFLIDRTNCYLEAIAASASHLTIYEA